jgi:hypothetical protein
VGSLPGLRLESSLKLLYSRVGGLGAPSGTLRA